MEAYKPNVAQIAASDKLRAEHLPTRLSIESDDLDYCRSFHVYLDGVEQTRCVVADAKEGYVKRHKVNALGFPIPSGIRKGHLKTEIVKGAVTFKLKQEAADANLLALIKETSNG